MKNIVTIDFDIIMAPSISLYNTMVPGMSWEKLYQIPQLQLAQADYSHYQKLTNFILNCVQNLNKNQIFFIQSHDSIIKILNKEETYSIVNIDHHHDLGYAKEAQDQSVTCANWAKWLKEKGICERFFWIKNENSEDPISEEGKKLLDSCADFQTYNLSNLTPPDKLIICLSPQWIPPTVRPLFFLWMDILNIKYNTHFDFID